MNSLERRAVASLAVVYILRMLGLFMVFPVFALYAPELKDATPALIGLALGIYGLTQAMLQIPMGMLSDWLGRRRIASLGLLAFVVGSLICMQAETIHWMIAGRALQGAGAVAAVLTAWLADLTRDTVRPIAMMVIGISIGGSFVLSLVLGPMLYPSLGVPGIFGLNALFAGIAILALWSVVPNSTIQATHAPRWQDLRSVISDRQLLTFDLSVFALHAVLAAVFVILPGELRESGLPSSQHWQVYLPAVVLSLPVALFWVGRMRRTSGHFSGLLLAAILVCTTSALMLAANQILLIGFCMFLFFIGFNYLEASLPSWVAEKADVECRGAAMGVFSTSQFLGIFFGGLLGGGLDSLAMIHAVPVGLFAVGIFWLAGLRQLRAKHPV